MKKKIIIFIKENFDISLDFFKLVGQKNIFDVKIIDYQELFSGKYNNLLKETSPVNIIIVLHPVFFRKISTELNDYLSKIHNLVFTNLLQLYTNEDFFKESTILSGSKHAYFLSANLDLPQQLNGFLLYLIKVFSETLASFRLQDYITHSFQGVLDTELLKKKNEEIERLNGELYSLNDELNRVNNELIRKNKTDSLTNLYNRATIFEFLEQEQNRTKRDQQRINKAMKAYCNNNQFQSVKDADCEPFEEFLNHYGVFSLMLIDIDKFKNINDNYGHLTGDDVLRYLGELLVDKEIFRDNDSTGRWGGEEFLVILPDTNFTHALEPAERFLKKIERKIFTSSGNIHFNVTVSIGLTQSCPQDQSKEDIIKRVDKALYYAKGHGRNQVTVYEEVFKK